MRHEAEDTVPLFALLLREAGMIKSTPQLKTWPP
jgi:hypothetical protein